MGKNEVSTLFSSDPDKYYRVSLFDRLGFKRNKCISCEKFFWSLVDKNTCPDHEAYNFIGNPPTNKRFDYIGAWKETEKYFLHIRSNSNGRILSVKTAPKLLTFSAGNAMVSARKAGNVPERSFFRQALVVCFRLQKGSGLFMAPVFPAGFALPVKLNLRFG